jgi:hypothetical protein
MYFAECQHVGAVMLSVVMLGIITTRYVYAEYHYCRWTGCRKAKCHCMLNVVTPNDLVGISQKAFIMALLRF